MPKPFDVTVKDLVEEHAAECIRFVELGAAGAVALLDADLSTISAEADKVIRVGGPPPWLVHLEFQASYDAQLVLQRYKRNGEPRWRESFAARLRCW